MLTECDPDANQGYAPEGNQHGTKGAWSTVTVRRRGLGSLNDRRGAWPLNDDSAGDSSAAVTFWLAALVVALGKNDERCSARFEERR